MRDVISVATEIITSDGVHDTELKDTARIVAEIRQQKCRPIRDALEYAGLDRSQGMSIYAPTRRFEKIDRYYGNLSLVKETGWDRVIMKYAPKPGESGGKS